MKWSLTQADTPISFLKAFLLIYGDFVEKVEFSKYISGGQGITIKREILSIERDILLDEVTKQAASLQEGEELAIHSKVFSTNGKVCLPLVDFAFLSITEKTEVIIQQIQKFFNAPFYLYSSGRSYHGYILKLIDTNTWHKYLGMLLLQNMPNIPFENIDSRWVGHSLQNEFSALRLTCNSDYYHQLPKLVSIFK